MKLVDSIVEWIRERIGETKKDGGVLGLSGGLDSAVVSALAKKALGDNLLGLIMPCYNKKEDEDYANSVASCLGIKTQRILLDPIYDYLINILPEGTNFARANIKPRLRMIVLYYFANTLNYLVIGTGNKSEIMVGYFTKYGDGGVDILPIGGLLKTEIRGLAKELEIPKEIIERVPSGGLWEGQTDEQELGITYNELDKTLVAIESGDISGISQDLVAKVKGLIEASQHKRSIPPSFLLGSEDSNLGTKIQSLVSYR